MPSLWSPWSLWSLCAALPALLLASQVTPTHPSEICQVAPSWEVQGHTPMEEHRGKVVVVALLKAS